MKNVIVAGLAAIALVGCSEPTAEDAGAVPPAEVVSEEAAPAEAVEVPVEVAPTVDEAAK